MKRAAITISFCVVLLALAVVLQAQQYQVIDLGSGMVATGVNDLGQVCGHITGGQSFIWQNESFTYLTGINAFGINDNGQVVGMDTSTNKVCIWQSGAITDLPGLPASTESSPTAATGINNDGLVVGVSGSLYGSSFTDWVWQDGQATVITTSGSIPCGINNLGQVVGNAAGVGPFIWQNEAMTGLTAISGHVYGINDSGQMVGAGVEGPCVWDTAGQQTYLPVPGQFMPRGPGSGIIAAGINDSGWVVGSSDITQAPSGVYALLWVPVPEPSNIVALICGMAGLGGVILRRKSA